jgi:PAS domain S-box-containing protein
VEPEALIGRNPYEMVHPEDREQARTDHKNVLAGSRTRSELRYVRPDGTVVWMETVGAIDPADEGLPNMIVSSRPISERKDAEQELRRHRDLLEQTQQLAGGWEVDLRTNELRWTDAVYRIHDLPTDATVGVEEALGFYPAEDQAALRDALDQVIQTGGAYDLELSLVTGQGEAKHVRTTGKAVKVDAEVVKVVGAIQDVTDRKQAQDRLRRSRERWRRLVENQRDGLLISVDREIQYLNPAAVQLLGADDPDALIGRRLDSFLTPEAVTADIEAGSARPQRGASTEPHQYEIERLDGEERAVEIYSVPIDYAGAKGAQTLIRDITERKRTQRQLQQAQKMETVGQLAGGIAHDFNNILHAVTAYVEMVQDGLPETSPDRELLKRATQGLGRAESLVKKLLTFSRQETHTQTEPVDLATIVEESVDLVRPSLPKNVTLRLETEEDCMTPGDPGQFHQVTTNILTNACHAMEADSPEDPAPKRKNVLDIDVRTTQVGEGLARRHLHLAPGRYVRLSISDTGPGMDEATKARIFEPFFTTKETGEGTGLGLAVVYGIVTDYDGEITVSSQPGEGTTFDVYLPYASEAEELGTDQRRAEEIDARVGAWTADAHVLCVDDDTSICEMETERVGRIGCEITTFEAAQEALKAFEEAPAGTFDLVLTDYAMPGMSGLDLTRTLREKGYDGPIVLMSGFSAQISLDQAQSAGVTAFMRKPVGNEELRRTLRRAIRDRDEHTSGGKAKKKNTSLR